VAKNKGGNDAPKAKKGSDVTAKKVRKAKNALKSGGRRGLEAYLAAHPDIKSNKEVEKLVKLAASMPQRPAKGKRGPKPPAKAKEVEVQPEPQLA
jgi:hypothetical protein